MGDDDPNQFGNSRRWIVKEVENSLRRLKTDWIDLYQIHRPEPDTDIDETLGALSDLVARRQGPLRSAAPPSRPGRSSQAQWAAERRGRERFICEQPPYSMLIRAIEADVLPVCEEYGMGVIPWSPLAGGWLSGRYAQGRRVARRRAGARRCCPPRYDMSTARQPGASSTAAEALGELAEEAGMSLIEMSLALRHLATRR